MNRFEGYQEVRSLSCGTNTEVIRVRKVGRKQDLAIRYFGFPSQEDDSGHEAAFRQEHTDDLGEDRKLPIIKAIKAQSDAVQHGARRIAPVHDFRPGETFVWYARDFYVKGELLGQVLLHATVKDKDLRVIIGGILTGVIELRQYVDRGHGNLKLSNVFLSGKENTPLRKCRVFLADLNQTAPASWNDDFIAVGMILHQLVFARELSARDEIASATFSEEWARLEDGRFWFDVCNQLLDYQFHPVEDPQAVLEALLKRIGPPPRAIPWTPIIATATVMSASLGAFLIIHHHKPASSTEITSTHALRFISAPEGVALASGTRTNILLTVEGDLPLTLAASTSAGPVETEVSGSGTSWALLIKAGESAVQTQANVLLTLASPRGESSNKSFSVIIEPKSHQTPSPALEMDATNTVLSLRESQARYSFHTSSPGSLHLDWTTTDNPGLIDTNQLVIEPDKSSGGGFVTVTPNSYRTGVAHVHFAVSARGTRSVTNHLRLEIQGDLAARFVPPIQNLTLPSGGQTQLTFSAVCDYPGELKITHRESPVDVLKINIAENGSTRILTLSNTLHKTNIQSVAVQVMLVSPARMTTTNEFTVTVLPEARPEPSPPALILLTNRLAMRLGRDAVARFPCVVPGGQTPKLVVLTNFSPALFHDGTLVFERASASATNGFLLIAPSTCLTGTLRLGFAASAQGASDVTNEIVLRIEGEPGLKLLTVEGQPLARDITLASETSTQLVLKVECDCLDADRVKLRASSASDLVSVKAAKGMNSAIHTLTFNAGKTASATDAAISVVLEATNGVAITNQLVVHVKPPPTPSTPTPPVQPTPQRPQVLETHRTNSIGMELAWVNGLPVNGTGEWASMGKGAWAGVCEVTQEQFETVMKTNTSYHKLSGKHPVENMTLEQAVRFCDLLTQRDAASLPSGWHYVLPTEEQWEFLAKGMTATEANAYFSHAGRAPQPVKQLQPNQFGLHDVLGNVFELTTTPADHQKTGGDILVRRGGSYNSAPASTALLSEHRDNADQYWLFKAGEPSVETGFRVLLVPGE